MTDLENTQQQKNYKILLIGDSCVDEYHWGTVDRISPEAPVPVLRMLEQECRPGMAANVALNLLAFGVQLSQHLSPPHKKVRIIDRRSGQHIVRIDTDLPLQPLEPSSLDTLDYSAVVVSDYNKGWVTYSFLEWLQAAYPGPIYLDTKKSDLARFNRCYIKVNDFEWRSRTTTPGMAIVTAGRKGAAIITGGAEEWFPAAEVGVVDVCGAGDTFLAGLAWAHLRSGSLPAAVAFANRCAEIAVGHRGVYALNSGDADSLAPLLQV